MNTAVTVYTVPNCPQCNATKRALTKRGIAHEVIDLATNPAARQELREAGYQQAPVIITSDGDTWTGYRPDKITQLAK